VQRFLPLLCVFAGGFFGLGNLFFDGRQVRIQANVRFNES
jgi:hypothetical protein